MVRSTFRRWRPSRRATAPRDGRSGRRSPAPAAPAGNDQSHRPCRRTTDRAAGVVDRPGPAPARPGPPAPPAAASRGVGRRDQCQQVTPLPQPSSLAGTYRQGTPVRSTSTIPATTLRYRTRRRPPLGRGGGAGSSGASSAHIHREQAPQQSWAEILTQTQAGTETALRTAPVGASCPPPRSAALEDASELELWEVGTRAGDLFAIELMWLRNPWWTWSWMSGVGRPSMK
jgi:hypothetical protein